MQVLEDAPGVGDDDPADGSFPDREVPLEEALDHSSQELEAIHIDPGLRLVEKEESWTLQQELEELASLLVRLANRCRKEEAGQLKAWISSGT